MKFGNGKNSEMILAVKFVEILRVGSLTDTGREGITVRFAAHFLAQNGGVVPREIQLGIRGITTERPHRLGTVFFVVNKNVTFFTFNQSQNINFAIH